MKMIMVSLLFCLVGMAVFAQGTDMSYYWGEYNNPTASLVERLQVLQLVQDDQLTGIGGFYHDALKVLLAKVPDLKTRDDREAIDASARILCRGLANEKYTPAAPELWQTVQSFHVPRTLFDGLVMQEAFNALGQVEAREFLPRIIQSLNDLNLLGTSDAETRRRIQRAVVGAISALEALHDPGGFRPVFFASVGWYDQAIKNIALAALPNIMDDPSAVIIEIIRDNSNSPAVKYVAWQAMLQTRAPNTSKARVAAVALEIGWSYSTSDMMLQRNAREMRKSAIDTIALYGAQDSSVYANLARSYNNNYITTVPDFDEIRKTLGALSVLGTEESGNLLYGFLRELNSRRRTGPWSNKERQVLQLLLPSIGASKTQSPAMMQLLNSIQRTDSYTVTEQNWARDALRQLGH